jgi:hypothetical protein
MTHQTFGSDIQLEDQRRQEEQMAPRINIIRVIKLPSNNTTTEMMDDDDTAHAD